MNGSHESQKVITKMKDIKCVGLDRFSLNAVAYSLSCCSKELLIFLMELKM
jgi:NADH:ubiquinone oxidoreductase subunit B-like Fe-S oxidoreductase